jgi:hypothetical protein
LTTDYTDSADEKQRFFIIRAIRVIRGFISVELSNLRFVWELGFGT